MKEKEKYFYLLSISDDQVPEELEEFGIEQLVVSSAGYYSDIEAISALNKSLSNLNSDSLIYKFNSTEYPVSSEDEFEDKSVIELGNNYVKLLMIATDDYEVASSRLIGKIFSMMSLEEYVSAKDTSTGISQHVIH